QQQLKAELERSEELFRRAAVEGALASLAADAEDLRRRQGEWNREDAPRPDSGGAARQRALADRADSLARGIERVATDLRAAPRTPPAAAPPAAPGRGRRRWRKGPMRWHARSARRPGSTRSCHRSSTRRWGMRSDKWRRRAPSSKKPTPMPPRRLRSPRTPSTPSTPPPWRWPAAAARSPAGSRGAGSPKRWSSWRAWRAISRG